METKKILKKQKKAEQKLKERMAKIEKQNAEDVIVQEESSDEEVKLQDIVKRERRQSNVSEGSVKKERANSLEAKEKASEKKKAEEDKEGDDQADKYFSTLEFKDLPLSEYTAKAVEGLGFTKCTEI